MHHLELLLSQLASVGLEARGRTAFRREALARLGPVFFPDVAVFHRVPPATPLSVPFVLGLDRDAESALITRWEVHAPVAAPLARTVLLTPEQGRDLLGRLTGTLVPPLSALLVPLALRGTTAAWLVIGRYSPEYGTRDREVADLVAPVLALGDSRQLDLPERSRTSLSARELEIVQLLCQGFRNPEIAIALGTSAHTVRNQLVRLYRKLGVSTRSELVWRVSAAVRRAEMSG